MMKEMARSERDNRFSEARRGRFFEEDNVALHVHNAEPPELKMEAGKEDPKIGRVNPGKKAES